MLNSLYKIFVVCVCLYFYGAYVFCLPLLLIFSNESFSFKTSFNKAAIATLSSGDQYNYMCVFTKSVTTLSKNVYKE